MVDDDYVPVFNNTLIIKKTISGGSQYIPITNGTRVKFHYLTRKCDNKQVIDDSRQNNEPFTLILGKQFKLEVWENIIQQMSLNEIACFYVEKSLVVQYPFISKAVRDRGKPPGESRHCCGMTIQNQGLGYKDLDDLFNKPCHLEFIIELLSIELPNQYQKDCWQLSDDEKLLAIDEYREKGNEMYKLKNYQEAQKNYASAVGAIESLLAKEKPHHEDWLKLVKIKIPVLSNYAQVRLIAEDYYSVIEHCTEIIKLDPENVKAYFRRGKAHVGAWNPTEAKADFEHCLTLDESLAKTITKELQDLTVKVREHNSSSKANLQKLFVGPADNNK